MKNKKNKLFNILFIISAALFLCSCAYLLFYLVLQPYYLKQQSNKINDIYYKSSDIKSDSKSSNGTLSKFSELLKINKDTKGWLNIPGTGIDYPVVKSTDGSDFYLHHNLKKNTDKNGCLYIGSSCNVKKPSKNIVIYGHNMESTRMMFYELPQYKDVKFYKQHPIITFDTIYEQSKWKIISFMRVSANSKQNDNFNYMHNDFVNDNDFLNFVYQIKLRSLYNCPAKINENDSLLMLSTCTYEIDNCRSVVVARKLRNNEQEDINSEEIYINSKVLYPNAWYSKYGGTAPFITTFEDALSHSDIDWYDGSL